MSIAEDVLESSEKAFFVLGYGNKTVANTMFKDSLNSLKKGFQTGSFVTIYIVEENVSSSQFGRVDSGFIKYVLNNIALLRIKFEKFLLCGPEQMIKNSSETLENMSFDKKVFYMNCFIQLKMKITKFQVLDLVRH